MNFLATDMLCRRYNELRVKQIYHSVWRSIAARQTYAFSNLLFTHLYNHRIRHTFGQVNSNYHNNIKYTFIYQGSQNSRSLSLRKLILTLSVERVINNRIICGTCKKPIPPLVTKKIFTYSCVGISTIIISIFKLLLLLFINMKTNIKLLFK